MLPLIIGALGAGLGAVQGRAKAAHASDVERETRNARSAEQRYSPWTGHAPSTQIQYANGSEFSGMLGGGLQGGMAGASLGQNIASAATPTQPQPSLYGGPDAPPNQGYGAAGSGSAWPGLQNQYRMPPGGYGGFGSNIG